MNEKKENIEKELKKQDERTLLRLVKEYPDLFRAGYEADTEIRRRLFESGVDYIDDELSAKIVREVVKEVVKNGRVKMSEESIKSSVLTTEEARKKEIKKKIRETEKELKALREKLKALEALEKKDVVIYVSHDKNNAQLYQSEVL